MKTHNLKTWPEYYFRVFAGQKKFEVRRNDRDFQINDIVFLQEWDPIKQDYTGSQVQFQISYILHGGQFGIEEGYVVFGLR